MRTYSDPDATALSMLDYTMPSDYALSSDCTGAPAWSSSPLGDPAVDDDEFFDLADGYGPQEWGLKPRTFRTGVAIAAAVLGALGVGASLGIAIRDFAGSPAPTPALVVPAASVATPATPQAGSPTTGAPAPAPAPTVSPVHNAAPVPVITAPKAAAVTNRVVTSSGNDATATDPGAASDAGTSAPDVAAPPPAAPHPSLTITIPRPPLPPILPMSKFLPPPPPVTIQIPLPAPAKAPCKPQPFCN